MNAAHTAFISLGSNEGTPRVHLAAARQALAECPYVRVTAVSSIYDTEPQELAVQPWFANQVIRLACEPEVTPQGLLEQLLRIETALGRVRSQDPALRYGPRCIDLDLLLFDDVVMGTEVLTLPHPRMHERAFVLVPLHEIEPNLMLPDGRSVCNILRTLSHAVEGTHIRQ